MKDNINTLLTDFGLTETQADVFIFLYKYWAKSASTVAQAVGWERTNIYKILKRMLSKWIISEITKSGTKHFFIADKKVLWNKIEKEYEIAKKKKKKVDNLERELKKLEEESYWDRPKITFFEWLDWLDQIYSNMYNEIEDLNYMQIKMFASNTLDNKSNFKFSDYGEKFLNKLSKKKISIEAYLWNGVMLLENIVKTYNTDVIKNIPAQNSTINTFIFWDFVYVIIFKQTPFAIKIENEEFAWMMHFLLEKVNIQD